MRFNTIRW